MIKVTKIDHVGIVVRKMEEVLPFYNLLGIQVSALEELPARGVKLAFMPVGESQVELLEPSSPASNASKFLEKNGEGLNHLCLWVEDIDGAVKELIEAGVKMIDQAPRSGGGGHRVAFVHPDAAHGVSLELVGH